MIATGARPPVWAVVPARLASSRLPEKVLADLGGRTMLEHVWRRVMAARVFDRVVVATEDERVSSVVAGFGGETIRTGPARNGTHRVALAVGDAPVAVVNVQADQPLLDPSHLEVVVRRLASGAEVCTLYADLHGDPADPARVKIVCEGSRAVRFSRRPVPIGGPYRLHVGIYGFGPGQVARCAAAPPSDDARAEDLEQVAWLDAGIAIHADPVDRAPPSVDTPPDLEEARRRLAVP